MTVSEKKTIRIKWVRSGIGFTYHQKAIVHSLGLRKLNHTVVRPDTPQIRGIVAAVPHLLAIVSEPVAAPWASIPEYVIQAPAAEPAPVAAPSEESVPAGAPAEEVVKKAAPKKARAKAAAPVAAKPETTEEKPKPRGKKKAAPAKTSKD